jgi:osmoprotectant transport system permease protein
MTRPVRSRFRHACTLWAGAWRAAALVLFAFLPQISLALDAPIEVGSKRFTESYLLGEIIADQLKKSLPADHRPGLGNTAVTLAALQAKAIDCYPEYLGTIELEILKKASASGDLAEVNQDLAAMHLVALAPLGFADRYALAIKEETAQRLGLSKISQLALHPELRFGLSQEFLGRQDGWPGLAKRYGLNQQPGGVDHGLAYDALKNNQVDVIDIYSTDARIASEHLRVLEDDRQYFPNYNAVILAREDLKDASPKAWQVLNSLANSVTQEQMIGMNRAVELEGQDFHQVAREFVDKDSNHRIGAVRAPRSGVLGKLFAPDLWRLLFEHVRLVVIAVLAAILIGVPLGIAAASVPSLRGAILGSTSLLQTIPTLALLAFLIPILGRIGTWPALCALFLYGLLPIVRNTAAGIAEVPTGLRQAALAIGLSPAQRLILIELPLCARVILAGIKTATVLAIGTATLAALIGAGGLGERITIGLALNDNAMLLAGAIPAAALALIAEALFSVIDRILAKPYNR